MNKKNIIIIGILCVCLAIGFTGCYSLFGVLIEGESSSGSSASSSSAFVPAGTYTFFPRLQAMQGGVDKKTYIERIESRGNSLTIYLTDRPLGMGSYPEGSWSYNSTVVLRDLDRPSRTYSVANGGWHGDHYYLTFERVQGTRFSLSDTYSSPNYIFEEIILEKPDVDLGRPALRTGIYTPFPRPRGIQGGVDKNTYIERIQIRGGFFTIFLTDRPIGMGSYPEGAWSYDRTVILQDLDYPQIVYNVTNSGWEGNHLFITFEDVRATRFRLVDTYSNPNYIFEEILLGEPD